MDNVQNIDRLIGRAIVSLETANKLGQVSDLLADPLSGELAGFSVQRLDESFALVSMDDVHDIGPDAVILERDGSLVPSDESQVKTLPRAKENLIGVKVITEHGQLLGNISNLFLCLDKRPVFIYEVRSSLFDKLLGRAFYFAASLGCAFSDDRTALVVTGGPEDMHHKLEIAAERLLGLHQIGFKQPSGIHIEVRSHAD
ncbi:MAG TPA: PRC-barrel domain-containing protein [Pyrinomonadaceae bacterium]|nr:PRC-barrel domain-containing protein [Pyrinomonadaceae bacterium]